MKTYENVGRKVGSLVDKKNVAYGDSFAKAGEVMGVLFPDGIKRNQIYMALAIVRILDKVSRLATGDDPYNENCWEDIAGYAILMLGLEYPFGGKQPDEDDLTWTSTTSQRTYVPTSEEGHAPPR